MLKMKYRDLPYRTRKDADCRLREQLRNGRISVHPRPQNVAVPMESGS